MTQIPARQRGRKKRLPSDSRLFRFTEEDEARMICAIASAVQYMKSYGKGRRPFSIVTDLRRYV